MENKDQKPIAEVFSEIYDENLWGGKSGNFYSGPGSKRELSEPYCIFLENFISKRFKDNVRVVDLGCGDFRVSQQFVDLTANIDYVGVDIVPKLIEDNSRSYANERVNFLCMDIVEDELPDGDVCLIRQVLQHLSNNQIKTILDKTSKYKYVFITEHYPSNVHTPNLDKPHSSRSRRSYGSAIYLDKEPFSLFFAPFQTNGEMKNY